MVLLGPREQNTEWAIQNLRLGERHIAASLGILCSLSVFASVIASSRQRGDSS